MAEYAYIGLGANLNDPVNTVKQAIEQLKLLPKTQFIIASPLYSSAPMGPQDQPDYVNGVALVETQLSAHELFSHTCQIEQDHGHSTKEPHGQEMTPRG